MTEPTEVGGSSKDTSPSKFIAKEFECTWQWRIDTDPELAASLGLLSQRRSQHALDPRSPESFEQRLQWIEKALHRIQNGITQEEVNHALTEEEKLSYELYVKQLMDYCNYTKKHKAYLCCVNRLEGPQTDLALYARYLPLKTFQDREFYLDFLMAIPQQLSEVQQLLTQGLNEKRTPPQISLKGVVPQIRNMVAEENPLPAFQKPIKDYYHKHKELSEADKQLQEKCIQFINDVVTKAFTKFADFLEHEYIPNLRTDISATTGYVDGESYYKDCLKFHTTTDMTPQEIHQLGLDETKRIHKEMEVIAIQAGYYSDKEGGEKEVQLQKYLEYLRTSKEFEPKSESELLAHFRNIVGKIYPQLLNIIHLDTLPRQPIEILETPKANAHMVPAAYYLAGSTNPVTPRPGMFYVNTSELSTRRTYECEALALHEAIPGHHTQGAIQGEMPLPEFRCYQEDRRYFEAPCRFPFYTGYIEGWGLHSETLGEELGLYKNPTDKFGQLSMEALRSGRLVVDTGMHAFGWTFDQALNYMIQNTAMGEHDASQEVARYITWPGQATAYKVGERFIRKMRTLAETELQDAFDPRDFYDVVLLCGAVPLDILEQRVKEYIQNKLHSPGDGSQKQENNRSKTAAAVDSKNKSSDSFVEQMTFANWCKCCVVPGSCQF